MEVAEDDIDDTDVDNLIAGMETEIKNKKIKDIDANLEAQDE